jgi:deoxyribodipyrimidine photo-lyase
MALEMKQPLAVVFCLLPEFMRASADHYRFMLDSLSGVRQTLRDKGIGFILMKGHPQTMIPEILKKTGAEMLVTDFNPLRTVTDWKREIATTCGCRMVEVDAHNILPARWISGKSEYSAYTLRLKINRQIGNWLKEIPALRVHPFEFSGFHVSADEDWPEFRHENSDQDLSWIISGEEGARNVMTLFIVNRLTTYDTARNDPNLEGQSGLSPYLHFGQLSAQRLALEVSRSGAPAAAKAAFLEELIVRRELADNFCLYNPNYDSFDGFPNWAKKSLNSHRDDVREYLYEVHEFESACTHDHLWNAAQVQLLRSGKMHGFMRMYWAKKILEWTASPEEALAVAIYLNDSYSLDGRDPNGYAGIAWSIGGTHDKLWRDRPVFGNVRFMNFNGCKRKFDTDRYIKTWLSK